jgi:hypothetical protein
VIIQGKQKEDNVVSALTPFRHRSILTLSAGALGGTPVIVLRNKNQLASVRRIREEACLALKTQQE